MSDNKVHENWRFKITVDHYKSVQVMSHSIKLLFLFQVFIIQNFVYITISMINFYKLYELVEWCDKHTYNYSSY